jgi:hypothetical protein
VEPSTRVSDHNYSSSLRSFFLWFFSSFLLLSLLLFFFWVDKWTVGTVDLGRTSKDVHGQGKGSLGAVLGYGGLLLK